MSKKLLSIVTALFVLFNLFSAAAPASALVSLTARGTVISINKRTHVMTLQNLAGVKTRLKYTADTKLTVRGRAVTIARLHVGDRLVMNYTPTAATGAIKGTATDGEDTPGAYEFEGLVSSVDPIAGTLDIASIDGGSIVTLKVDSSTVITREDAAATLADLQFGDRVEAKYNSGNMLASSLKAETDVENDEAKGVITAIDTATGDITFTPLLGGADITIHTNAQTVFMFRDSPGKLSNLQVGDEIEAKYDATTLLAGFVEVEVEHD